jgi:hypothetical protein
MERRTAQLCPELYVGDIGFFIVSTLMMRTKQVFETSSFDQNFQKRAVPIKISG